MSLTETQLAGWFIKEYICRCAELCPDIVSRLFDDVTSRTKLQNAVSAIVDWRLNSLQKVPAMEDYVVGDDKSKMVTEFFLKTCRPLAPSEHHVHIQAATVCAGVSKLPSRDDERVEAASFGEVRARPDSDDFDTIPLTTGSVAEMCIQPMLSCVGDVDIMVSHSNELAIQKGSLPPSQLPAEFRSRVKAYEIIDSEYPGYVYLMLSYLLTKNADADKYDSLQCDSREYLCQ